jgi:hypothetical protein
MPPEGEDGPGTFAQALAAMKRRGSALLVVGVAPGTHVQTCSRLLGEAVAEPRRRLLVLAGSASDVDERLPDCGDDLRVLDRRARTRSAAATSSTAASATAVDLDRLEREVRAELDAIEAEAGRMRPAELRVCLDSVAPFLDSHSTDEVRSFVASLADRVRDADGMLHVHLPVAYDDDAVEALSPAVDGVVEVAPGEQRWHLHEADITTKWLEL